MTEPILIFGEALSNRRDSMKARGFSSGLKRPGWQLGIYRLGV